ncbi:MAG TPA: division/cell wall cluster transcriptional repressor MraZ [Polyangiaceae bacterium]|jgi:MraZ protein|nr:division/cell wall cluster transcriptional repressor MraZ [Polyangiaceae bacterium]
MFRGHFMHSVDAKGRISLPVRFRELIGGSGDARIVLAPDLFDPCLQLYPLKAWEAFEQRVMEMPSLARNTVSFRRRYVSAAVECELDGAGRVLVPPPLREKARLEKDAVWAGMGQHLELWAKAEWERALEMTPEQEAELRSALEQVRL